MHHQARSSDCNTPNFLTSRSNYDDGLKKVINKFSVKFTKINKTLSALRKTKQAKQAQFNPNKLENLKTYNKLIMGPFKELRNTLKGIADDVSEGKIINPVDFTKATHTSAYDCR